MNEIIDSALGVIMILIAACGVIFINRLIQKKPISGFDGTDLIIALVASVFLFFMLPKLNFLILVLLSLPENPIHFLFAILVPLGLIGITKALMVRYESIEHLYHGLFLFFGFIYFITFVRLIINAMLDVLNPPEEGTEDIKNLGLSSFIALLLYIYTTFWYLKPKTKKSNN